MDISFLRYTGKNPNNYVLFNNELWRMIGIFDGKIKIIKNDSIKDMSWDSGGKMIGKIVVYIII